MCVLKYAMLLTSLLAAAACASCPLATRDDPLPGTCTSRDDRGAACLSSHIAQDAVEPAAPTQQPRPSPTSTSTHRFSPAGGRFVVTDLSSSVDFSVGTMSPSPSPSQRLSPGGGSMTAPDGIHVVASPSPSSTAHRTTPGGGAVPLTPPGHGAFFQADFDGAVAHALDGTPESRQNLAVQLNQRTGTELAARIEECVALRIAPPRNCTNGNQFSPPPPRRLITLGNVSVILGLLFDGSLSRDVLLEFGKSPAFVALFQSSTVRAEVAARLHALHGAELQQALTIIFSMGDSGVNLLVALFTGGALDSSTAHEVLLRFIELMNELPEDERVALIASIGAMPDGSLLLVALLEQPGLSDPARADIIQYIVEHPLLMGRFANAISLFGPRASDVEVSYFGGGGCAGPYISSVIAPDGLCHRVPGITPIPAYSFTCMSPSTPSSFRFFDDITCASAPLTSSRSFDERVCLTNPAEFGSLSLAFICSAPLNYPTNTASGRVVVAWSGSPTCAGEEPRTLVDLQQGVCETVPSAAPGGYKVTCSEDGQLATFTVFSDNTCAEAVSTRTVPRDFCLDNDAALYGSAAISIRCGLNDASFLLAAPPGDFESTFNRALEGTPASRRDLALQLNLLSGAELAARIEE